MSLRSWLSWESRIGIGSVNFVEGGKPESPEKTLGIGREPRANRNRTTATLGRGIGVLTPAPCQLS